MIRWNGIVLCCLLFASARICAGADVLGSEGTTATPEHPFGFRGDGSGRFPGATPMTTWSSTKSVRWAVVVGASYSSPIVSGDWVAVAAEPNLLICLNRADGKERWRVATTPADVPDETGRAAAGAYEPPKNGSGSTAATPVTDGRNIYAVFANGIVRAIGVNGKPKWTACITAPASTGYGRAASPILIGGKLIVHMSGVYAFDAETGKQLWANADAKSTYATPAWSDIAGTAIIITPGGDVLRLADGKGVADSIGSTQQASPIVGPDGVIYFPGMPLSAVRLAADFKDTEVWTGAIGGDTFGSPLLLDKTLYLVNADGQLFAFDTGGSGSVEPLINGRPLVEKVPGGPAVFSSLTLAGKYLFLNSNRGETVVMEATRDAKLVARNQLTTGGGSSPVFCGKDMYIRDGEKLLCIGN